MNPFLTAADTKELDKVAKKTEKTAEEVAALQAATEGQKELKIKEAGIKYEAIQFASEKKRELEAEMANAFKNGGVVTIRITAQEKTSDEPVEMEINLSNLAVGNNAPLVTHRENIRVQTISFVNQQIQLANQELREADPVSLEAYQVQRKKAASAATAKAETKA